MTEKWVLPERYQLNDPAKLKLAAQAQSELAKKANSPFTNLSPAEAEFVRAQRTENHIVKIINDVDPVTQLTLRRKLSDALAAQGRFAEAVEIEPSAAKQEELKAYRDAGSFLCSCVNEGTWKNKPFRVTAQFVKRQVWNQKPFIGCAKCGQIAQVDLPSELVKQRELRQQSRDMAVKKDVKGLQKYTAELLR